jgi:hypothetical protein
VQIWRDKWLPTPTTYAIQSPRKILSEDAKVSELIDIDTKWWNERILNSIFCKEEVAVLSRIPLSKYGHNDLMTWRGSSSREFTVRSAYHMEKDHQMNIRGECSHQSDFNLLWKKLWGMKVPNSTKMFVSRACHNILPNKDNLLKKGMDLDPYCCFCKIEREMVHHVLWECAAMADVWGVCGRQIQKCSSVVNSFTEVMDKFFAIYTLEEVDINAEIARRIWFRRNSVVHGGYFLHPNEVILSATNAIVEYNGAMAVSNFFMETATFWNF